MIRNGIRLVAVFALLLAPAPVLALVDLGYYLPPAGAPYGAEEVRVRSFGRTSLGGILTHPARSRPAYPRAPREPAVILVGPGGGRDRDGADPRETSLGVAAFRPFYALADTLSRRGIAVLRLDDRGVGASTGRRDSVSLFDRVEDLRASLEFLRRRGEIDRGRITLLGMEDGALVVSAVAATDTELAGVVLMEPSVARDASPRALRAFGAPALVLRGEVENRVLPAEVRGEIADWLAARREVPVAKREAPARVRRHRHRR